MSSKSLVVGEMEERLAIVEFLASSSNRVLVLDALSDGPLERHEIREAAGFSRATLSRTLARFEERGWIVREDGRLRLTELGEFVAAEFARLLDRMEVVRELRDVVRWFPADGYGFDLGHLANADVVRPSKRDALAPTNRIVERLKGAGRVRVMTYSMLPVCVEACWLRVLDGSQEVDLVFEPGALAAIDDDPTTGGYLRDLLAAERARVFRYEGDLPYVLVVADDAVTFCLSDGDGVPHAVIDTTDESIHEWAEERFESYRRDSVPVES